MNVRKRWWFMLLIVPIFIPFASVVDSLLFYAGYNDSYPFLLVNFWEYSIFASGVLAGYFIAKREFKRSKTKIYTSEELKQFG